MSSLLTNVSAISALRALTATQKALTCTEDQVSTGLRVADASDNAAYWSISTAMKSQTVLDFRSGGCDRLRPRQHHQGCAGHSGGPCHCLHPRRGQGQRTDGHRGQAGQPQVDGQVRYLQRRELARRRDQRARLYHLGRLLRPHHQRTIRLRFLGQHPAQLLLPGSFLHYGRGNLDRTPHPAIP
ncbi:MAG: hypothetical protein INR62_13660, partial [Rhodospirillales bacterium]|nr:hypothetical protein [Acetobacter sp.]